jgi:hypothetical protein
LNLKGHHPSNAIKLVSADKDLQINPAESIYCSSAARKLVARQKKNFRILQNWNTCCNTYHRN